MIIGITGHQIIEDASIDWVRSSLIKELDIINATKGMSCLAKGADQLFAEIILRKEINLIAVIPSKDYETTFDNYEDLYHFKIMLKKAAEVKQMDSSTATEAAFYRASQYIVDHCDILFAIWDNKPPKGYGGTADVVNYARGQRKKIVHFNPYSKTIKCYNHVKS